ncbi:PRA1 family protein 2 [Collichthys lucidus]|uniref:PRA1 family protein n=1 Tax=Collichthys lucidus TaxID=240159 RepID=A0A4U5VXU4_COLLU|nr:PRA1 family protein 2 [Collichthys lucidus]
MADVQPPPLRSLDDFLLSSARFALPDVRDLDRWNNRIINNLLYYQSNYLLSALCFLLMVGYCEPFQLFVGATVVTLLFLGFVWAAENQAPIRLVLIHASVRLRSLKNKLENRLESIGLKRTPMGLLLEALGQEQEAGS